MQQQLKKLHSNLEEAAPSFASYPSTKAAPHAQLATVRDDAMKQSQALADVIREAPRFGPAIEPRFNFRGPDVVEILEEVGRQVGSPKAIRVDQGTATLAP